MISKGYPDAQKHFDWALGQCFQVDNAFVCPPFLPPFIPSVRVIASGNLRRTSLFLAN